MGILERTLHVALGLGVVTARKTEQTLKRLEEEGRAYLEAKGHPEQAWADRVRRAADAGRDRVRRLVHQVYTQLGLTPVQETERLHRRLDDLEERLSTHAPGSNS